MSDLYPRVLRFKSFRSPFEETELHHSPEPVKIYACGITPDGPAHVGHMRMYTTIDIVLRIIKYKLNRPTMFMMNITDFADSIAEKSKSTDLKGCLEFAKANSDDFFSFMSMLDNSEPVKIFKVSEHIPQIQKFVKKLYNERMAMVGRKPENESDIVFNGEEYKKEYTYPSFIKCSKTDLKPPEFAIWKTRTTDLSWIDADPQSFPMLLKGIPGWHTECATFLDQIGNLDIHFGGRDLLDNYHFDNQYAQIPNIKCKIFAFVGTVKDEFGLKMSKSMGNAVLLKDIFKSAQNSGKFQLVRKLRLLCMYQNFDDPIFYHKTLKWVEINDEGFSQLYTLYYSVIDDLRELDKEAWDEVDKDTYKTYIQLRYMIEISMTKVLFSSIFHHVQILHKEISKYILDTQIPKAKLVTEMFTYFKFVLEDIMGLKYEYIPKEAYEKLTRSVGKIVHHDLLREFLNLEIKLKTILKFRNLMKSQGVYEASDEIRRILKRYGIFISDRKLKMYK